MEKLYRPHRYFFIMGKNVPRVTIILIGLWWLFALSFFILLYRDLGMLLRLSVFVSITLLFLALLAAIVLHEVCGTVIKISETSIVRKSPYKTIVVHFDRITEFKYFGFPLIKGFGRIQVGGGSLLLTFFIDRLDECIEEIRLRLDASGKRNVYNERNIFNFKQKAIISELGVKRMLRGIAALYQFTLGSIAISFFVSTFFWEASNRIASFQMVISWALAGLVFPIAGFLFAEVVLNVRTIHAVRKCERENPFPVQLDHSGLLIGELKTYWFVGFATVLIYVVTGIFFKKLF